MTEITFVKDSGYHYCYYTKRKMPSGMTAEVSFIGYVFSDSHGVVKKSSSITYYVAMNVYKKRKQKEGNYLENTGKDGVATLRFAREAIKVFEKHVEDEKSKFSKAYIAIEWDDNRRRNVYHRGLKNIGFDFVELHGEKVLAKIL